jgi:DNA-binding transcriptional MocR family regulator
MCSALNAALPASPSLYTYEVPDGGMFLFLKFNSGSLSSLPSSEELFKRLASAGVIVVPGDDFRVPRIGDEIEESERTIPIRLTYAASQPQQIIDGINRLGNGIREILGERK